MPLSYMHVPNTVEMHQSTVHSACGIWVPEDIRIWVCSYSHHVWSAKWGFLEELVCLNLKHRLNVPSFPALVTAKERIVFTCLPAPLMLRQSAELSAPLNIPPSHSFTSSLHDLDNRFLCLWLAVCLHVTALLSHTILSLAITFLCSHWLPHTCSTFPFLNITTPHPTHTHTHISPLLPPYTSCLLVLSWLGWCYCEFSQCATQTLFTLLLNKPKGECDPNDTQLWACGTSLTRGRGEETQEKCVLFFLLAACPLKLRTSESDGSD